MINTNVKRRKFLIEVENWFAVHPNKPGDWICYRTVICNALLKFLPYIDMNKLKAITIINEMHEKFNNNEIFRSKNFLHLFPFKISSKPKVSYLLVDKSRGSYPIVAYNIIKSGSKSSRYQALKNSIEDINKNSGQIIDMLLTFHEKLDEEKQKKLQLLFHYED